MARLSAAQRRSIPKKLFGLPSKSPARGSYPMPDKKHARLALQMDHNASPEERQHIQAKAHALYPGIKIAGRTHSLSSMAA